MAYIIQSGHVKVYTINNAGEEQIVTFHSKHDIFPSSWLFNKASTSLYYYETFSDCQVATLPRDVMSRQLGNPTHAAALTDYLATNYISMLMRVTALEQSRAREKIMFTLYQLLFRYGIETKPDTYVIELPLTHSIIASLVGLTRETTTAELNQLRKQKIISYHQHTYTVHKAELERTIGEDGFKDILL